MSTSHDGASSAHDLENDGRLEDQRSTKHARASKDTASAEADAPWMTIPPDVSEAAIEAYTFKRDILNTFESLNEKIQHIAWINEYQLTKDELEQVTDGTLEKIGKDSGSQPGRQEWEDLAKKCLKDLQRWEDELANWSYQELEIPKAALEYASYCERFSQDHNLGLFEFNIHENIHLFSELFTPILVAPDDEPREFEAIPDQHRQKICEVIEKTFINTNRRLSSSEQAKPYSLSGDDLEELILLFEATYMHNSFYTGKTHYDNCVARAIQELDHLPTTAAYHAWLRKQWPTKIRSIWAKKLHGRLLDVMVTLPSGEVEHGKLNGYNEDKDRAKVAQKTKDDILVPPDSVKVEIIGKTLAQFLNGLVSSSPVVNRTGIQERPVPRPVSDPSPSVQRSSQSPGRDSPPNPAPSSSNTHVASPGETTASLNILTQAQGNSVGPSGPQLHSQSPVQKAEASLRSVLQALNNSIHASILSDVAGMSATVFEAVLKDQKDMAQQLAGPDELDYLADLENVSEELNEFLTTIRQFETNHEYDNFRISAGQMQFLEWLSKNHQIIWPDVFDVFDGFDLVNEAIADKKIDIPLVICDDDSEFRFPHISRQDRLDMTELIREMVFRIDDGIPVPNIKARRFSTQQRQTIVRCMEKVIYNNEKMQGPNAYCAAIDSATQAKENQAATDNRKEFYKWISNFDIGPQDPLIGKSVKVLRGEHGGRYGIVGDTFDNGKVRVYWDLVHSNSVSSENVQVIVPGSEHAAETTAARPSLPSVLGILNALPPIAPPPPSGQDTAKEETSTNAQPGTSVEKRPAFSHGSFEWPTAGVNIKANVPTTTQAPTTQAPTTQAPTTQASTTQSPTTKSLGFSQTQNHQNSVPKDDGMEDMEGIEGIEASPRQTGSFGQPSLPAFAPGSPRPFDDKPSGPSAGFPMVFDPQPSSFNNGAPQNEPATALPEANVWTQDIEMADSETSDTDVVMGDADPEPTALPIPQNLPHVIRLSPGVKRRADDEEFPGKKVCLSDPDEDGEQGEGGQGEHEEPEESRSETGADSAIKEDPLKEQAHTKDPEHNGSKDGYKSDETGSKTAPGDGEAAKMTTFQVQEEKAGDDNEPNSGDAAKLSGDKEYLPQTDESRSQEVVVQKHVQETVQEDAQESVREKNQENAQVQSRKPAVPEEVPVAKRFTNTDLPTQGGQVAVHPSQHRQTPKPYGTPQSAKVTDLSLEKTVEYAPMLQHSTPTNGVVSTLGKVVVVDVPPVDKLISSQRKAQTPVTEETSPRVEEKKTSATKVPVETQSQTIVLTATDGPLDTAAVDSGANVTKSKTDAIQPNAGPETTDDGDQALDVSEPANSLSPPEDQPIQRPALDEDSAEIGLPEDQSGYKGDGLSEKRSSSGVEQTPADTSEEVPEPLTMFQQNTLDDKIRRIARRERVKELLRKRKQFLKARNDSEREGSGEYGTEETIEPGADITATIPEQPATDGDLYIVCPTAHIYANVPWYQILLPQAAMFMLLGGSLERPEQLWPFLLWLYTEFLVPLGKACVEYAPVAASAIDNAAYSGIEALGSCIGTVRDYFKPTEHLELEYPPIQAEPQQDPDQGSDSALIPGALASSRPYAAHLPPFGRQVPPEEDQFVLTTRDRNGFLREEHVYGQQARNLHRLAAWKPVRDPRLWDEEPPPTYDFS